MILRIYALYDATAQEYYQPSYARSDAEYLRSLQYQLKSADAGILGAYPDDFRVAYLGQYDTSTGQLVPTDKPSWILSNVADLAVKAELAEWESLGDVDA